MNREKALVPPTILALADLASVWGPEGRLRVLPEELKAITDRLDKLPEVLASVSQEVPLRGGLALQQMRMLEEYQRLMSDLVSGVSQTAAAARGKEMVGNSAVSTFVLIVVFATFRSRFTVSTARVFLRCSCTPRLGGL